MIFLRASWFIKDLSDTYEVLFIIIYLLWLLHIFILWNFYFTRTVVCSSICLFVCLFFCLLLLVTSTSIHVILSCVCVCVSYVVCVLLLQFTFYLMITIFCFCFSYFVHHSFFVLCTLIVLNSIFRDFMCLHIHRFFFFVCLMSVI